MTRSVARIAALLRRHLSVFRAPVRFDPGRRSPHATLTLRYSVRTPAVRPSFQQSEASAHTVAHLDPHACGGGTSLSRSRVSASPWIRTTQNRATYTQRWSLRGLKSGGGSACREAGLLPDSPQRLASTTLHRPPGEPDSPQWRGRIVIRSLPRGAMPAQHAFATLPLADVLTHAV